jgi:hypothetical protein
MQNRSKSAIVSASLLALLFAHTVAAEERPRPALELAAGILLFADDGVVKEGFVGGTARLYVQPRVSVGPEIAYIQGERHHHVMLTGSVTFDFLDPFSGGRPRSVMPYAVVGAGLFQTNQQFPNNDSFSSSEGAPPRAVASGPCQETPSPSARRRAWAGNCTFASTARLESSSENSPCAFKIYSLDRAGVVSRFSPKSRRPLEAA